MKKQWSVLAFLVAVLSVLVSLGPAQVSANGVSCPLTITEDTVLESDLSCSGTAIVISADDIVLDGNGYMLAGSGSGSGVELNGRTGVVVRNLNVRGFSIGISLAMSSASTIEKNHLIDNNRGIRSWASSQNVIEKNQLDGSFLALRLLYGSNDNVVAKNVILNTTGNALNVEYSDNNEVFENELFDNTWGIGLYSATGNTIEKNAIFRTIADGLRLSSYSTSNAIDKNLVEDSGWNGYLADATSVENTFDKNESVRNGDFGFKDLTVGAGTSGTANTYTKNSGVDNVDGDSSPSGLCSTLSP